MMKIGESFGLEPEEPRQPTPGMGMAVARRTVFRESDGEDWGRVADRVAEGNIVLSPSPSADEQARLRNAIACGALLTSGRHLQHGDSSQKTRSQEVFTNCATSATTYGMVYLLLCGSGVGRSYDDDMMVVDWSKAPRFWLILRPNHPDFPNTAEKRLAFYQECTGAWEGNQEAADQFFAQWIHTDVPEEAPEGGAPYHEVDDSREGWAKAVEIAEACAHEGKESLLILNFSKIRQSGSPIVGMQNRPCAGPMPWMRAFVKAQTRVTPDMPLWRQAMEVDHAFAEEVLVGDVRRAARMSTKSWRDPGVFDFITVKNKPGSLWTSNNSVMVDREFYTLVRGTNVTKMSLFAKKVFGSITENSYVTGEPGMINGDKLWDRVEGSDRAIPVFFAGEAFSSSKYQTVEARGLLSILASKAANTRFPTITNPCSEKCLSVMGGFCVVGDAAPILACPVSFQRIKSGKASHRAMELWDRRVEDSIQLLTRFLIRVNLMDSVYGEEVRRTNRIGVSLTGIHEWAWLRWGYGFLDLIDEEKSQDFWDFLANLSRITKEEDERYSAELGMVRPTTDTTIKPAGSVSKLFNLTEGVHLPARRQYLRWVQFKGTRENGAWTASSNPLLADYEAKGYPVRELKTFPGMSIVGFPTMLAIQAMGIGDKMVTASEATPEQQYQWLRLIEKYWIGAKNGSQVSYTLKINTEEHSLDQYRRVVLENQPTVKCCSVLPYSPSREQTYEYLPESQIDMKEFRAICHHVGEPMEEDISLDDLRCEGGACPI